MKSLGIMSFIWIFVQQTSAQTIGNIHLSLHDQSKEEKFYTIVLKKSSDSSLIKIEHGSSHQEIIIENILFGNYFIDVMYMNKKLAQKVSLILNTKELMLGDIDIEESALKISDIKITAQKNILERKFDKLIYNVENTLVSPADDAFAILQKAPGISVDQNGNISMRGKSGVMFMVNGKLTYLQGEQLNSLLKSTMANQISKVEIISNPSSKYDANGNAGIVNIVLKKNQSQGSNATLTLGYGTGFYRKTNNSLSVNHRNKKLNMYGSYNFINNVGFNDLKLYRKFYKNGQLQGAYRQHNYLKFPVYYHVPKVGFDYLLSQKTSLGLVVTALSDRHISNTNNKTIIEDQNLQSQSYYTTTNRAKDIAYNYAFNLNAKHIFDSTGRELTSDFDFAKYGRESNQNFKTNYFDLANVETQNPYLLNGDIDGNLNIKALKIDYVHPNKNGTKLEAGAKTSLVSADNDLAFYDVSNGTSILDTLQSNHFIYTENINALYSNYLFEKNKMSVQIGLRTEQTVAKGDQKMGSLTFKRNYWQLFPTFFISQKLNDKHELGFTFSRRILRPTYQQLNPFKYFIDANTFKEGNPYLVPQDTYLFEINHTFKQQIVFTLNSGVTNKSITEVLIPVEGQNNITIQTSKNVNKQYIHSLGISAPYKMNQWWNAMFDVSTYYSKYKGELAAQFINSSVISAFAKTMHTFTIPKQFTLQVDAFIQFPENYSFSTNGGYSAVNMSIQKSILKKKVSFKLSANDIFYTSRFKGSSHFNNYHEDYYVQRDSRTVMMSFTYRFGNNAMPATRRRTGGAEDEKQRAG